MNIGIVPRPTKAREWPQIKVFLEPAAKRGGVPILEQHEEVWTVIDDGELIAAATARILPEELTGEIVLVGGRDFKRWLGHLDWLLAAWFRMEGMKRVRAYGRRGWARFLHALGWVTVSEKDGVIAYEKAL